MGTFSLVSMTAAEDGANVTRRKREDVERGVVAHDNREGLGGRGREECYVIYKIWERWRRVLFCSTKTNSIIVVYEAQH